jgi:hypothetical protein
MTSEEIIEKLIDEKKITVKDAMVILKDLAKESVKRMFYPVVSDNLYRENRFNYYDPDWSKITIDSDNNSLTSNSLKIDDSSSIVNSVYKQ